MTVTAGGQGHIIGAGGTIIDANQPGNANYEAAYSNSQFMSVDKAPLILTFPEITVKAYGDADFNPGATVDKGFPVAYTSNRPSVATIVNGQIHIVGAGSATITARTVADETNYLYDTRTQDLTVNQASSLITFAELPAKYSNNPVFDLVASGNHSEAPITFSSPDPSVVSVSNSTGT